MILRKLKRLLGLDSGSNDSGRSERDVTVQGHEDTDAENEAAVKGADTSDDESADAASDDDAPEESVEDGESDEPVAAGTDAGASTESLVDEEITEEDPAGRAEQAEAAGQESDETSDEDEPESPDVDVEEEAGADDSPPVDEIKGIGPAYSDRLGEIGIDTVADLRGADAAEVAERTTAPEGTVQKWIDRANDHE